MKLVKWSLPVIISAILLGSTAFSVFAQTPEPVTLEVDRRTLGINEVLILTITIDATNGNPVQPLLPPFESFEVNEDLYPDN